MAPPSKSKTIAYWVTTSVLALVLIAGGVFDLMVTPEVAAVFEGLGYPLYLLPLLGVAKLLAVAAILAPRFQRLKEWAYAGVCIDLLGAAYSHAVSGHGVQEIAPALAVFALTLSSWLLRPADRKLAARVPDPQ